MSLAVRRTLIALFVLGLALTLWFGLLSALTMPAKPVLYIRNDHLLHVCAFSFLALVGLMLWAPMAALMTALVAGAGLLEVVQRFVPQHQMSLMDWGASSSGVALGAILFLLVRAVLEARKIVSTHVWRNES